MLTTADDMVLNHVGTCDPERFRNQTITALQRIGVIRAHRRVDENKLAGWLNAASVWRVFQDNMSPQVGDEVGDLAELLVRGRRRGHPALWTLIWAAIADVDSQALRWLHAALCRDTEPAQLPLDLELPASSDLPPALEETLMRCATLGEAAVQLRVAVHTLRRWLDRNDNLRRMWRRMRYEERRRTAVASIEVFMRANLTASRSDLLLACKADVAWLDTHDPGVLVELLNAIPSSRARQQPLFL